MYYIIFGRDTRNIRFFNDTVMCFNTNTEEELHYFWVSDFTSKILTEFLNLFLAIFAEYIRCFRNRDAIGQEIRGKIRGKKKE